MRALLCKQFGPPEDLVVEQVPDPEPGAGEVVVDVAGCGVNFPDVLMLEDKYQFKPELPFSPGGEIAGTVRSVGAGVDDLAVGDRVLAVMGAGGMAEQVAVLAASTIRVPDGVDLVQAAGFLLAHGTSHHALVDRAGIQPGETLLVLGAAGGVGLAAVELGALLGARVIAAASSDGKLELCRSRGATETINYATENLRARLKELTDNRGVDVCYDPVGGDLSEPALRSMAWDGRFLVVGFAAGEIPRIPLNLVLLKGCQIVGVFYGSFTGRQPEHNAANVAQLLEWLDRGEIVPHVAATYPLERAAEAITALAEREARGKLVVIP